MGSEMLRALNRFCSEEQGAVLTEALVTLLTVIMVTAIFVEFTFIVFQFNQANAALQIGSRLASISDPVVTGYKALDTTGGGAAALGDPPQQFASRTCTYTAPNSVACSPGTPADGGNAMRRIVFGGDFGASTQCSANFTGQMGMCEAFPVLARSGQVEVVYQWADLGYADRPAGPVPIIRVTIRNVNFDLPVLGTLLGMAGITMPAFTTTSVVEDFSQKAPDELS